MLTYNDTSLRPVKNIDADLLYEAINSPEIVRYNSSFKPIHQVKHEEWFENILGDTTKQFFMIDYLSITVGSIQLVDIQPIHRNAELRVRIFNEDYRGKNIGTNAVNILCNHAFSNLGLVRVWLEVFANNSRAIAAYKKAGFSIEGTMRNAAYINGKFLDVIIMGKLNE